MSIAWLTKLYRLNETGRFEAAAKLGAKALEQRPNDWAVHLQCGKAHLALGELAKAQVHFEKSVQASKGLAAWPWFYVAALHARRGEHQQLVTTLRLALARSPMLEKEVWASPFFAAAVKRKAVRELMRSASPPTPRRKAGYGRT